MKYEANGQSFTNKNMLDPRWGFISGIYLLVGNSVIEVCEHGNSPDLCEDCYDSI